MSAAIVAVLVTLDSKGAEARFICDVLAGAGAKPWLIDLSLRPHDGADGDLTGGDLAKAGGSDWQAIAELERGAAADVMVAGGIKVLQEALAQGRLAGAIGVGGANGTTMACAIMRSLPPLFPKVMVSAVAATGAVQWYVAGSDIAMFPTMGDTALNRIMRAVLENASRAVSAMAQNWLARQARPAVDEPPLIGVSSFGGTQTCVDRVTERLIDKGYEVIHFHASGPGGKALENLSSLGELAGVIDVTTHELTDLVVDGVYNAGEDRLKAAGAAGLPQVIVPGAMDHANFWTGQVPDKFKDREFFQYNAQNFLMRTGPEEFEVLGRLVADRLNAAKGPFVVLIPKLGFSEHTKRQAHDIDGKDAGPWMQPETDAVFAKTLKAHLKTGEVKEFDLHINDPAFGDVCFEEFEALLNK